MPRRRAHVCLTADDAACSSASTSKRPRRRKSGASRRRAAASACMLGAGRRGGRRAADGTVRFGTRPAAARAALRVHRARERGSAPPASACAAPARVGARVVACDRAGASACGRGGRAAATATTTPPPSRRTASRRAAPRRSRGWRRRAASRSWRRADAASTWRCGAGDGAAGVARATCRTTSSSSPSPLVADARWLPGTPQTLVVGTGFVKERLRGEVRLYDVRAQRRPVLRTHAPAGEEAVSAVACTADGLHVVAGSVSGTLVRLDVRGGMPRRGGTRAPPGRFARWRRRAAPSRASASTGCSACTAPPTARCASAST